MSRLNASGRKPGGDHVAVLQIDEPDEFLGLRQLKPTGYEGPSGHGTLALHGFDAETLTAPKLRFWMINHQPPVDETMRLLDATKLGANSTVEVFEVTRGLDEMINIMTFANSIITTPNGLAATGDGGFLISNDHSSKLGWVSL